jgi:hypothetical protein
VSHAPSLHGSSIHAGDHGALAAYQREKLESLPPSTPLQCSPSMRILAPRPSRPCPAIALKSSVDLLRFASLARSSQARGPCSRLACCSSPPLRISDPPLPALTHDRHLGPHQLDRAWLDAAGCLKRRIQLDGGRVVERERERERERQRARQRGPRQKNHQEPERESPPRAQEPKPKRQRLKTATEPDKPRGPQGWARVVSPRGPVPGSSGRPRDKVSKRQYFGSLPGRVIGPRGLGPRPSRWIVGLGWAR